MRKLTRKSIVDFCRNKFPAVSPVTVIRQESTMAIILNSSITVDETSGLQNAATSTDIEDINDNDITVAAINATDDTGDLPFPFESRLFALLGATPVKNAALSGYTGAAGNTGADLITITGTYVDLAFTDAQGKALGDPGNANGGSDWSGLYTLDGTKIFLYSDTNNNIVLGRAGSEGATPAPDDDLANPNGTIIFAAYLEQTATGAKVWMVQQEQLMHPDTANPDDVVDMTNHLWVTASQDLAFDFAGLPSGQNGFLMFKAGGSTTGLIVTGMDPDQVPANQADTVNTSQGAGPTTIGTNSQGIKAGEGMIFSFITNPDARYTVPDLTHGEATNESNILFGGLFAASGATIIIAQATPPKTCAATISAFTTGLEVGSAYYDGLLDGNGHAVNGADNLGYIASVTVIGANGVAIAGLTGVTTNTTLGSISVIFTTSNAGLDRTATIVGFEANFSLQYTVDGTHNRVVIENSGTGNSTFDIGGFHLPNVVAVPQEVGSQLNFEDDGPAAAGLPVTALVDEDSLAGGIDGGVGDAGLLVPASASGTVATVFTSGTDAPASYSLSNDTSGVQVFDSAATSVALASKGETVKYDVIGNTLWGYVGAAAEYVAATDRAVFKLELTNTSDGSYTFTLLDQLDHPDTVGGDNSENELLLQLGSVLKVTDKDGDSVTATAQKLVITVDDDTPIATLNQLTGTVDEDGVLEGAANAGPGDGIAGGTGDVAGEIVLASGNVSTLFQSGADEALNYSLTTTGMAALGLTSGGVAVTYAVGFDAGSSTWLLTASAGAGNTVFTFSLHAATGAYAFTLVDQLDHAYGLNENDLTIALGTTINATDFDGDSVTAAANGLVITVDDDTPIASINLLTGTVDEDGVHEGAADSGPGDGIPGGTGDVAGEVVLASGNVSALFQSGADEPLSYSLTTNGLTALGLKSGGVTVTYATTYDAGSNTWLLTASAGAGNSVFTFSVQAATGAYAFMLLDQLDHAAGQNENDLNIALGTAINATDYDGDSVTAAANGLLITVDDDSPVVTVKSNVVYANSSNPTPGGTGVFAYDIGADDRLGTVYSSANSDLSVSMGDSTVGTTAITNKVVTWASESDTSAVFNLSFTYVSNNPTLGALTNATGTMTFDKVADTYTLSLADDIDSFSILKTSAAQGFTGYNIGGTTPINQQPPVSVAKLADDFFVQFSGFAEQGSGTGANNIMAGGNNAFVPGELFSAATSWVSVSGTAAGVAGDTIQQGEVMDLDFFTASPFGDTTAAPTATSKGIYVKFDGIGSEDLILVLKLIDPDDNSLITRAIIVDSEDIIIKNASTSPNNFHPIANPAAYGITLDQNDGAVIVESNDYNFGNENYVIQGLQVLVSTEGVTGSGYNLNGNVGVSGASTGNTLTFSNESGEGSKSNPVEAGEAGTWDGDVVKITDLGFVTSSTPDAHLTFNVVVTDADADATPAQTLDVTIEGDKTFTGGVGADTFNFSGLDTDGSLTAATAVISAGFTSGVDTLNFPTAGTGANYTEVAAPAANVAAFITAADTALNGTTNYYFGVVGGDGYLAYDGDGTGITSIIKLVGVTDIAPTDIV